MDFTAILQRQRVFFQTGATRSVEFRLAQLKRLAAALERHEAALLTALQSDLGKSPAQGYATEVGLVQMEIRHALRHLRWWSAPKRLRTSWFAAPSRSWTQPEPFGVTLIIGPWNYPLQLLLAPLVSAIAAGNCVVLKSSELAPHTAEIIEKLLCECFEQEYVFVATGGADVSERILQVRFDKIFFTGSTRVGRLVMAAAAKHLTPVTLELGGKCPAIVCADASIELAARRIVWGKFMNAGQTCVAPDFVFVADEVLDAFVTAMKQALREFYGDDPAQSPDYGRIINRAHFDRLISYLPDGKIAHGGQHNVKDYFIAPTVLTDVDVESSVMQEEIFGPILPVLRFHQLDEALDILRTRSTPLALYLFTRNPEIERHVLEVARSGGACVNDVVSHTIGAGLPFGGLGESGMGSYHGRAGFDAFSHHRTVLRRATWLDLPFRYPPQKLPLTRLKHAVRYLLGD